MKLVINNDNKLKNTIYLIVGFFALSLFIISKINPSYAIEGKNYNIDTNIVTGGETNENLNINNIIEDGIEEINIQENDVNTGEAENNITEDTKEHLYNTGYETSGENLVENIQLLPEVSNVLSFTGINNEEEITGSINEIENITDDSEDNNEELNITDLIDNLNNNKLERNIEYINNTQLNNRTFEEITVNRPSTLSDNDGPEVITIMDRNLGASVAGLGSDSYGYYYQWGNNYGFTYNSSSTTTRATWNDDYSGGYYGESFIYGYYSDYRQNSVHYNNLWGGGNDNASNNRGVDTILETQNNRRGPCPEGRHVPSAGEWGLLVQYWAINNNNGYKPKDGVNDNLYQLIGGYAKFQSDFKIPLAGGIYYESFNRASQGNESRFWSSSTFPSDDGYSRGMSVKPYEEVRSSYYDYHRANGRSVRCMKNYGEAYFTVTYNTDEGVFISSEKVLSGEKVKNTPTPEKIGHNFSGWNISGTNNKLIEDTPITGNLTLNAIFDKNIYTISWNDDKGNLIDTTNVEYQGMPTHEDHEKQPDGTYTYKFLKWNPELQPATGNTTYTAEYTPIYIDYEIKFNDYDGRLITGAIYHSGDNVIEPEHPKRGATYEYTYIFTGWGEPILPVTGSKVYTAHYDTIINKHEPTNKYSGSGRKKSKESNEEVHGTADNIKETTTSVVKTNLNRQQNISQENAYSFAKENGITTSESIKEAKMNTELTRIQMAKMLSNFAINVLGEEPDVSKGTADFDDVTNKMDEQYDNAVTKAYQLGIMGQNVKDNEFRPNDKVTRAELVTALSRMLYNTEDGTGKTKYYEPHMYKLYNEGIIINTNPNITEKRGYSMIMLLRATQGLNENITIVTQ